jgi:hypothetical protein
VVCAREVIPYELGFRYAFEFLSLRKTPGMSLQYSSVRVSSFSKVFSVKTTVASCDEVPGRVAGGLNSGHLPSMLKDRIEGSQWEVHNRPFVILME